VEDDNLKYERLLDENARLSDDNAGFTAYAKRIFEEYFGGDADDGNIVTHYGVDDIVVIQAQQRTLFNLILFFVYGFVGMLALIAVTSVVSTISTNIRSREREFAVLQSVGMTSGGIRKMLNLESVMSAARSLVFGLPLGLIGAYGIFRAMGLAGEIKFTIPWLAVAECVAGLFIITWLTMRFAASRLKGGSIIGAIRNDGL